MLIYTPYGTQRFEMTGKQLRFYDHITNMGKFYLGTAPRQSGKSTFLTHIAKLHSDRGSKVLLVSPNHNMSLSLSSMVDCSTDIHYTTFNNLHKLRGLKLNYDLILLDEYEYYVANKNDMFTVLSDFITTLFLRSNKDIKIFGLTTPYGNPNMTLQLNRQFIALSK